MSIDDVRNFVRGKKVQIQWLSSLDLVATHAGPKHPLPIASG